MTQSQLLPFANHLFQTTLFAAAVALLTIILRKNGAHVRYWLWLSASVKFLIPLSALVGVGGLLGRHAAATIAPVAGVSVASLSAAIEQVGEPFTTTVAPFTTPSEVRWPYTSVIVPVLIAIWAVGFVILVCRWAVRWRRMRMSVRAASPLQLPVGVPSKAHRPSENLEYLVFYGLPCSCLMGLRIASRRVRWMQS
jgi:beta-lactamase regulating signal transducer with metallopeptidase domain